MPFKKRNVAVLSRKKFLKSRLMQISICVDNLIYKNKPISVEDASNYINEIAAYRTQCEGDIHSLQVIEKLTRFMKTIIEETTKNNSLIQNVTTADKESIAIITHTSVNHSQDKTTYNNFDNITTNPNFRSNVENQNSTLKISAILTPKEISNKTETSPIIIIESDDDILDSTLVTEKELNKNVNFNAPKNADSILGSPIIAQSSLMEKKEIKNLLSEKYNLKQKSFRITSTPNISVPVNDGNAHIIYDIVNDATNNECFLRSVLNPKQTCNTRQKFSPPLRIDKVYADRNENKSLATEQGSQKRNRMVEKNKQSAAVQNKPVVEKKRRKSQNNATKEILTTNNLSKQRKTKNQNLILSTLEKRPSIESNTNTYTAQNKENLTHVNLINNEDKKSAAVEKKPVVEKKRRKSQNDATKGTPTKNLSKQSRSKNQYLIPSTHEERSSIKSKINTYTAQHKDNHTHVNLINNEVLQTSSHKGNDLIFSVNDETLISTQMNSLKIYNEQFENDLSWVESIRYVREVSNDEFDSNLSNLEEDFWHNLTLPSGWSDIEFLY